MSALISYRTVRSDSYLAGSGWAGGSLDWLLVVVTKSTSGRA